MLHLDTRVHLDEIRMIVLIYQELQRTGVAVSHLAGKTHGAVKYNLSCAFRNSESRRVFHHLLVTALHGTVTVEKMHYISIIIGKNLYLDMLRLFQIFLQEDLVIAEGLLGFLSGFPVLFDELLLGTDDTHTAAAAPVGSL